MKLATVMMLVALTTPAMAQEKIYTLKLTGAQVNVIGKALGVLPYSEAKPIVDALQPQIAAQDAPPKVEAPQNGTPEKK